MTNWKEVPRCEEDDKEEESMKDVIAEIRADRKKRQQELKEKIIQQNPQALFADGLDDAIAGYTPDGRVVYHIEEIIGTLMTRDEMTEEEALEFFYFNIECAYVGEFTPLYYWEE